MRGVRLEASDGTQLDAVVHDAGSGRWRGAVVLAHGIANDIDEDGNFSSLGEALVEHGFACVRFSFRGHGDSGGRAEDVTIAGQLLDLQAVFEYTQATIGPPVSMLAGSFGAVATCLCLSGLGRSLESLVLWYPVLDLRRTFLEPELPWGLSNFGPRGQAAMRHQGYLLIDGWFRLGRELYEELERHVPVEHLTRSSLPLLIAHGDRDTYVSYEIARKLAKTRPKTDFITISGAEHGFDAPQDLEHALRATVSWLVDRHPAEPS